MVWSRGANSKLQTPNSELSVADCAISQPVDLHISVGNLRHLPWRLLVAFDAPAHRLINRAVDSIHFLNLAVTGLTRDTRAQMRHVCEVRIRRSRQTVNTMPRRFGVIVGVLENLLHFGTVSFHGAMAERTFLHAGNEHARSAAMVVLVAESAFQPQSSGAFLSGVFLVAVSDRLHGRARLAECDGIAQRGDNNQHDDDGDDKLSPAQGCFPSSLKVSQMN